MKKVFGLVLAAIIAVNVGAVLAGDGCCMGKTPAKASGACEMSGKLNLTDAQKTKLTALQEEAKRAPSTSEAKAIMSAGLERILTPEQLAQCKASCEKGKAAAGKCPFMSKTEK